LQGQLLWKRGGSSSFLVGLKLDPHFAGRSGLGRTWGDSRGVKMCVSAE